MSPDSRQAARSTLVETQLEDKQADEDSGDHSRQTSDTTGIKLLRSLAAQGIISKEDMRKLLEED